MSYNRYQKKLDYSYSLGIYPTVELLTYRPQEVIKIFLAQKSENNKGAELIKILCKQNQITLEINDGVINKLSPKENCLGVGIFKKYKDTLQPDKPHIILVNPSNTGNLGTILRTMIAFGFSDLVIIEPGVDMFMPEVIRSSMGSLFQCRIEYIKNIGLYMGKFTDREIFSLMTDGEIDIKNYRFPKVLTLIFGNESSGLPAEYNEFTKSLRIPINHKVDSLNLSIAAGIALYEAKQI